MSTNVPETSGIYRKKSETFPHLFRTFSGRFPENSQKCSMFRNIYGMFPECFWTFPEMSGKIRKVCGKHTEQIRNISGHFRKCSDKVSGDVRIFPEQFGNSRKTLLCFAMFCYVLLCFCYALLCFAMFCYVFVMFS